MPKILNLPKFDAAKFVPDGPWDLIRIGDPASWFTELDPKIARRYNSIHEFEFLDADEDGRFPDECMIQPEQAKVIMDILFDALENDRNVLVHCNMGLCRSGAVVEVGVVMGFDDPHRTRIPNIRVERMLFDAYLDDIRARS